MHDCATLDLHEYQAAISNDGSYEFQLSFDACTGYMAYPFGKSRYKNGRVFPHWMQRDVLL
jgi:hypothetical protein